MCILFSQFRPGNLAFFPFHKLSIHVHMHVRRKTFVLLWGTVMWPEMGKQNIQVKKVSCLTYPERTRKISWSVQN